MNLLDEQTTLIFQENRQLSYKKFSMESLGTHPFGSELCAECLVGKGQVWGSRRVCVSERGL